MASESEQYSRTFLQKYCKGRKSDEKFFTTVSQQTSVG